MSEAWGCVRLTKKKLKSTFFYGAYSLVVKTHINQISSSHFYKCEKGKACDSDIWNQEI
jgi:hypothetical protein